MAVLRVRPRGDRAAAMYSLIITCKMNRVDPQAWLADVSPASPTTPRIGWMSWRRGTGRGGPGQLRSAA